MKQQRSCFTKNKKMKTLSYYKARYRNAKTGETKAKVMNGAMNLSHRNQQKFISWQVKFMNGEVK